MLTIPSLADSPFVSFSASFMISPDEIVYATDDEGFEAARHDAFFGGDLVENRRLRSHTADSKQLVLLDRTHDADGYYVDLTIEPLSLPVANDPVVRESVDIEKLANALFWFDAMEVTLAVSARFWIKRSDLPSDGVVDSMIGLTIPVSGEELLITGAQWSPRAFPNDMITWSLHRGGDDDFIGGTVARRSTEVIGPSVLSDSLYLASSRFNRFVVQKDAARNAV